jgi:hypothetical protein
MPWVTIDASTGIERAHPLLTGKSRRLGVAVEYDVALLIAARLAPSGAFLVEAVQDLELPDRQQVRKVAGMATAFLLSYFLQKALDEVDPAVLAALLAILILWLAAEEQE